MHPSGLTRRELMYLAALAGAEPPSVSMSRRSPPAGWTPRSRPRAGSARVRPEYVLAQTGYMQGASGIGLLLLHLDAVERGKEWGFRLPDSPY